MLIHASIPWPSHNVGCFDPAMVLWRMQQAFGDDLEFDTTDLFAGHYERIVESATQLGIPLDRSVVTDAARRVRELSPRYLFRLRVGPDSWAEGQVDRYCIALHGPGGVDFSELLRYRFVEFLRSLQLGSVEVGP